MNSFTLKIVTPDGLSYEGQAQKIVVRTEMGDVCLLARHADYVAPIAKGKVRITLDSGEVKNGFCEGGFVSMNNGNASIVSDSLKWE